MSLFDVASMKKQLEAYKKQMETPDFWDDIKKANETNKEVVSLEESIRRFSKLSEEAEDLGTWLDLEEEEPDESLEEEIKKMAHALQKGVDQFYLDTLLGGKYDKNNAILSLHAGAGGTEAQDWVSMLYRMYTRWAERRHYDIKVLDLLEGEEAGVKSVTMVIEGKNAYGYLKGEKGVHRLVRISPFDASARRHTSFASVDVMPEIMEDDSEIEIRPEDLRVDTYRSSGKGGQHVNKTDSAVRMTHIPTGIVVQCQNERSQIQNRETCMRMLRSKLANVREEERKKEMESMKGEMKKIEWGSQIRSYVFQPYTLVKDHRTSAEMGNIVAVMDGDIDLFINEYLKMY